MPAATKHMTPEDVAESLDVPVGRVVTWIETEQLRAVDVSAKSKSLKPKWRIDPADLIAFLSLRATLTALPRSARRVRVGKVTDYASQMRAK